MVDKIDKTTLKILLFIVFLVILYLIVNRKKQIKEGFQVDVNTLTEDEYILHIFKTQFFPYASNPWEDGPLLPINGVRFQEKTKGSNGLNCSGKIKVTGITNAKNNLYNSLKTKIDKINSSEEGKMSERIEQVIKGDVYDIGSTGGGDIISQTLEEPYSDYKYASRKTSYRCEAATKIYSINYNGQTHNSYATLIAAIKNEHTTKIKPGQKTQSEDDLKLLTTAKKKEVIKSYLNILESNNITLTQKDENIIIDPGVTGAEALQQKLYTAMKDYTGSEQPIIDAVTVLLNRKKAIDIGIDIGKQYLNIFEKIIEENDFGEEDKKYFDQIKDGLKNAYYKIPESGDIYPNCKANNMVSLDKEECSNFRSKYVSENTNKTDTKYGSLGSYSALSEANEYMRQDNTTRWLPNGCSYRNHETDFGIHYSNKEHLTNEVLPQFNLICKDYNIDNLTFLSTQITNNNNLRDFLSSILTLLDTRKPLTVDKINIEITKLQGYVDTHIDNEKKKLTSIERITLENSFNLI